METLNQSRGTSDRFPVEQMAQPKRAWHAVGRDGDDGWGMYGVVWYGAR